MPTFSRSNAAQSTPRNKSTHSPGIGFSSPIGRFLPPSHYAAAAGIAYNHDNSRGSGTVRGSRDGNEGPLRASSTDHDDIQDRKQFDKKVGLLSTRMVYQSDSSNSSFEYRQTAGSRFYPPSSDSPESTQDRLTRSRLHQRYQYQHRTEMADLTSAHSRRQSQIPNLPMIEANLLPSLRDTVDRMTGRSPNSIQSPVNDSSVLSASQFKNTGTGMRSQSASPAPHHTPNLKPAFDPSSSLSTSAPQTPKPAFSSSKPHSEAHTPTHPQPKSVLKSSLRAPTPKRGFYQNQNHAGHDSLSDSSVSGGVLSPSVPDRGVESSPRKGPRGTPRRSTVVVGKDEGNVSSPSNRRVRNRSCTDPGTQKTPISDPSYRPPLARLPATPQPKSSSTFSSSTPSSLPRRSLVQAPQHNTSRTPTFKVPPPPPLHPPLASQSVAMNKQDSDFDADYERRAMQNRRTLVVTNATEAVSPSESNSSAASSGIAAPGFSWKFSLLKPRVTPGRGDTLGEGKMLVKPAAKHGLGLMVNEVGDLSSQRKSSSPQPKFRQRLLQDPQDNDGRKTVSAQKSSEHLDSKTTSTSVKASSPPAADPGFYDGDERLKMNLDGTFGGESPLANNQRQRAYSVLPPEEAQHRPNYEDDVQRRNGFQSLRRKSWVSPSLPNPYSPSPPPTLGSLHSAMPTPVDEAIAADAVASPRYRRQSFSATPAQQIRSSYMEQQYYPDRTTDQYEREHRSSTSVEQLSSSSIDHPHSPYLSDDTRRRREEALQGIVSGLNLDLNIAPGLPKIFGSSGGVGLPNDASTGSGYFQQYPKGLAISGSGDVFAADEAERVDDDQSGSGYVGQKPTMHGEKAEEEHLQTEHPSTQRTPSRSRSRTPSKKPVQAKDESKQYLAEYVHLARRSSIVKAQERTTWGLPPSESDSIFLSDKDSVPKLGATMDRRLPTDMSESSVGSVYWDDEDDSDVEGDGQQFSTGAQALFRRLSKPMGRGRSSSHSSSWQMQHEDSSLMRHSRSLSHLRSATASISSKASGDELAGATPLQPKFTAACQFSHEPFRGEDGSIIEQEHDSMISRQQVIWELLHSEELFVSRLQQTIQLFVIPLRVRRTKTWIAGIPLEITRLFDWLEDIMNLHCDVLSLLRRHASSSSHISSSSSNHSYNLHEDRIADDLLKQFITKLEIYQPYLVEMPGVLELVKAMVDNAAAGRSREGDDFGHFVRIQQQQAVKQHDENASGTDLSAMLIEPVNRLSQYPEIFRRLLSCASKDHPDYISTLCLVHSIEVVIRAMMEVKVREDEYQDIKSVADRIEGFAPFAPLITRERRLLVQGKMNFSFASSFARASRTPTTGKSTRLASALDAMERGSLRRKASQDSVSGRTTESASTCWTAEQLVDSPQSERPIQAFVFTDLLVLVDVIAFDLHDPQQVRWVLMEEIGISRVLGVEDVETTESEIKVDLVPYYSDDRSASKAPVHTVYLRQWNSEDGPKDERWSVALRRCFEACIRELSHLNLPSALEGESQDADLASVLNAGLPFPKSPSVQVNEQLELGPVVVEIDGRRLEREARGWWAIQLRSMLRELKRRGAGE